MDKKIYNVKVSVVELVEAESEEKAVSKLSKHLDQLGLNVHGKGDAFESELLHPELKGIIR